MRMIWGILEQSLKRHHRSPVEGLRMDYLHFYGSYQTLQGHWRKWYRSARCGPSNWAGASSRSATPMASAWGFPEPPPAQLGQRGQGFPLWMEPPAADHAGQAAQPGPPLPQRPVPGASPSPGGRRDGKDEGLLRRPGVPGALPRLPPGGHGPRVLSQDWAFDDGIATQAPAWIRQLDIALAYPFRKRIGGMARSVRPSASR